VAIVRGEDSLAHVRHPDYDRSATIARSATRRADGRLPGNAAHPVPATPVRVLLHAAAHMLRTRSIWCPDMRGMRIANPQHVGRNP
jgi:hypothetical protein